MLRSKYTYAGMLASALLLYSCNSSDDTLQQTAAPVDTTHVTGPDISEEAMNDIIQSIPSPVEMTSLIKSSGAKYDETILNPSGNVDKYTTNYRQAFNIGVYSADLGYLNIYEKSFAAIGYLNSIKTLADDIQVGQFFDFETLKKLATNSKNVDSLLYISTSSFNKMDRHLREKKRGELSVLIVSGAWLEGLYIATEVAKTTSSKDLVERIGAQKINLDNILLILNAYKKDKYFADIVSEFDKLKKVYDKVTITYEYHEPESKEVNGQLVIVDNSTSTINITDDQLKEIISITGTIRKTLVE